MATKISARVEPDVRAILDAVRERGDEAVLEYTERFDRRRPASLVLNRDAWLKEARAVDPAIREALASGGRADSALPRASAGPGVSL